MRQIQLLIKRLADIVLSAAALILLSPILLLIALVIKIKSPGPVFFRQKRLGRKARIFRIFKFRTMHHNAPVLTNADGSTYTGTDDPRIFPIGSKLRKYSLDELPQFINVFLGDMSIVGPRPDMEEHLQMYGPHQMQKLDMKPGITGWAAVNGRNSIPWEKRVELDIWYIDHYSLWLDLKTALMTIPVLLFGKGINQKTNSSQAVKD